MKIPSIFRRKPGRSYGSYADYIRRSVMRVPISEGPVDKLLLALLRTFADDVKVQIYAGDIRTLIDALYQRLETATSETIEAQASLAQARSDLRIGKPKRATKQLTISFDWDTGRCTMEDDGGDVDGSEAARHLFPLIAHVLDAERRAAAIAEAEVAIEDARATLDRARRAAAPRAPTS